MYICKAILIIVAILCLPQPVRADQPVFLGRNLERNGYDGSAAPGPLKLNNFYQDPIDSISSTILSSPTISHGKLYGTATVFDPPYTYGSIFCLDFQTLELLWRIEEVTLSGTTEPVELFGCFSSPAVSADGRYVVFGQGLHNDKNSNLLCFETSTGKLHWSIPTELHIESSPSIQDDLVVVGCGAIEDIKTKQPIGNPGYVLAVKISTGEVVWTFPIPDPESSPAVHNNTAFVGSGKNGKSIAALRTASDEELKRENLSRVLWRTPTPIPVSSPITLAHGLVIAGGGNGTFSTSAANPKGMVIALDQETGNTQWMIEMRDSVFGAISVHETTGIITSKSGEVIAVDIRTGDVLWKRTPKPGHAIIAGAAFTGDYVYAVTTSGYLIILDASNAGKTVQYLYLNNPDRNHIDYSVSAPVVVDSRVYVGSESGGVRSYSTK